MPRPPNPTPYDSNLVGFSVTSSQTPSPAQPSGNLPPTQATPQTSHFVSAFNVEDGAVESEEVYSEHVSHQSSSRRRLAEASGRHGGGAGVSGEGGQYPMGMPEARDASLHNISDPMDPQRAHVGGHLPGAQSGQSRRQFPAVQGRYPPVIRPQTSLGIHAGSSRSGSITPRLPQHAQMLVPGADPRAVSPYPPQFVPSQAVGQTSYPPTSSSTYQSTEPYQYTASRSSTPSCCRENTQTHTLFILSVSGGVMPTTMAHHAIGVTSHSPWFVCPTCGIGIRFQANGDSRVPPIGTPSALFFDERSQSYQSFQMNHSGSRRHSLDCPYCAGRGRRTTLVLEVQVHHTRTA